MIDIRSNSSKQNSYTIVTIDTYKYTVMSNTLQDKQHSQVNFNLAPLLEIYKKMKIITTKKSILNQRLLMEALST